MIERQFVAQKLKEVQIHEYFAGKLSNAGYTHTEIQRTPLGEKVIIYTTRPGLVVGRRGDNIKKLTAYLKKKFKMENPQIEIGEVEDAMLDARYVADNIAFNLERYGSKRFKSIGYKVLQNILNAGALGAEVVVSGKLPSARAKTWRFSAGYLKKSGDIAQSQVKRAKKQVKLKMGAIGIKVNIMTPDIVLPDKMLALKEEEKKITLEEITPEKKTVTLETVKIESQSDIEQKKESEAKKEEHAREKPKKSPRAKKQKIESKEEKIETLKQTAKSESSQNEAKTEEKEKQ
ncbi:MAG: 30S ribosomal protein S3 [Nanoarchaeota archaeon]